MYSGIKILSTCFCGLGWPKKFPRAFLISGNGFGGCVRKNDFPTVRRTKTKKAETDSFLNRSPLFLFPVFQYFVQCHIQCGFQALLHNAEYLCFQNRLFLLLFLLIFFALLAHFFTFTSQVIFIFCGSVFCGCYCFCWMRSSICFRIILW